MHNSMEQEHCGGMIQALLLTVGTQEMVSV